MTSLRRGYLRGASIAGLCPGAASGDSGTWQSRGRREHLPGGNTPPLMNGAHRETTSHSPHTPLTSEEQALGVGPAGGDVPHSRGNPSAEG